MTELQLQLLLAVARILSNLRQDPELLRLAAEVQAEEEQLLAAFTAEDFKRVIAESLREDSIK